MVDEKVVHDIEPIHLHSRCKWSFFPAWILCVHPGTILDQLVQYGKGTSIENGIGQGSPRPKYLKLSMIPLVHDFMRDSPSPADTINTGSIFGLQSPPQLSQTKNNYFTPSFSAALLAK